MSWIQFQFETALTDLEIAEQRLESLGALAITLTDAQNQPLLEPLPGETPLWQKISVLALFPETVEPVLIKHAFFNGLEANVLAWRYKNIEDQEWERAWMDDFHPMQFGSNLWICPSWHKPPEPDAVNLMLDPGLAFGSGTHPTTALCLEWLDANPPKDLNVIDFGCGSGILSLAAIKLGANFVTGIDLDPQAIEASHDNAARNQISKDKFNFLDVSSANNLKPADLLVANILSGPLIQLAPQIQQLVKPAGSIILSGIIAKQLEDVVKAYRDGFERINVESKQEWQLISATRKI